MRIVYLADAPYVHTRRWVEHSVSLGFDSHVISFRPATITGATVHFFGGPQSLGKGRYLIQARQVRQLVRALQPDLVHALHLTSYGFLAALAGFHPLVTSVWGTDILEAPKLSPLHRWVTELALKKADVITATSLRLATETTRYSPRSAAVEVVPYGVDTRSFSALPRPENDSVTIGCAARFSSEKGVDVLLHAFSDLRRKYGDRVELSLAGEGPEEGHLRSLAADLGLGESVRFRGWIEHGQLPAFLQEIDIFALPSRFEGFGVAAVEASSMELPVVASSVDGVPDVVRNDKTGFLVRPDDPAALSAGLGRLVENATLRRSLGRQGRLYVLAHYDWADNTAQMERTYERLLSSWGKSA